MARTPERKPRFTCGESFVSTSEVQRSIDAIMARLRAKRARELSEVETRVRGEKS